ncbi:calcium/sodium antiporter [Luteithermobacter gelatinilyticus]|uniref:calcium/sodium antiporter n=1 Tax=Luteithermobacter gelatinilyticus TaxID=2582913 RepID=UPI001106C431|nr:calcium/sodium antiporter [Luteithermobacter gelatinilyticus]|tara:strand:+ start:8850 stop:9803 length:954 start_codon:yes stop_codon:yes gene_type:complete
MEYIQVIGGLFLLVYGGDWLVNGSVCLAQKLGVGKIVIGLTVVAFGTSAPELVVGVDAALSGAPTLALGNVVGSNIANILLVIGVPALFYPFSCYNKEVRHNYLIMLVSTAFFILLALTAPLAFWQGGLLLILLFAYLYHSYRRARKQRGLALHALEDVGGGQPAKEMKTFQATLYILGGIIGLLAGAHILVMGAVTIAQNFGISEAVIGLTIIAVGTSLPELMTSIMAAKHQHGDVAVGNVLGSNLFNLHAIMGATALTAPIPVPAEFFRVDLWVMAAAALILLPYTMKKISLNRLGGSLLSVGYIGYLAYLGLQL